ncbi:MAG: glycoside hydrolase family 9 protein [Anaeromyxobacter sp.]|nr:glycoside hydrolase family 9 protein [Anaeromyxobacter sp.]MBL0275915.1 glycoside hydrolase family 9 protein [Anaeromyxobacter sp.]
MSARRAWAAAGAAALLAGLLLALAGPPPLDVARGLAKRLVGYPAWRQRAAGRDPQAAFDHLATSQVGYAPAMPKAFTSPRPFTGFRVVDLADGRTALRGGGPAREVPTALLGDRPTAWIGDFTPLAAPGRYRVELDDGLASFPFQVGPDVFEGALRATQRALYFQRAFTAIEPRHAEGPWSHASDAHLAPPGVRQGWHDAGDFTIYSASAASTLFWLLSTAADFAPVADDTNLPESGNGRPDLLDEAGWGLGWLLSVQDGSGGFRNTTCQEAYGPYGTNRPEGMPPYRDGEVGSLATARAVGILAFAAEVLRPHDPALATRCLAAARRGYRFLEARPGEASDGPTCPNYRQDGDQAAGRGARLFAAAGLLLATGEARFRQDFEADPPDLSSDPSAYRFDVFAALLYLRAPAGDPGLRSALAQRLAARAAALRREAAAHPFRWSGRYHWGSIGAAFHRSAAFSVRACLADPEGAAADCAQALDDLHYALGRNALQLAYLSGLEGVSRGRRHAFHHWLATLGATPHLFPGLVAGGPAAAPEAADRSYPHARPLPIWGYWGDPAMPRDEATPVDGRYTDNDSWSTNEVDVDWQAVTLYQLHFARWWARRGTPGTPRGGAGAAPDPAPVLEVAPRGRP